MSVARVLALGTAFFVASVVGCDTDDEVDGCKPGVSTPCSCDGAQGCQTCRADNTYAACDCSQGTQACTATDGGGTGGSGGAGATGGVGATGGTGDAGSGGADPDGSAGSGTAGAGTGGTGTGGTGTGGAAGGAAGGPTIEVACGTIICTPGRKCCNRNPGDETCSDTRVACTCTQGGNCDIADVSCDGAEDCASGEQCCAVVEQQNDFGYSSVLCRTACAQGEVEVCGQGSCSGAATCGASATLPTLRVCTP